MWHVSTTDLGLLFLIGIAAVGFADIMGALVVGQHRDARMDQWDATHGFGATSGKGVKRPLKHRARRVWKRAYTARTIRRACAAGRDKAS
jgi:hypothetical protein